MTKIEVVRGLMQFQRRLKDVGEVYSGDMYQQEYDALNEAIDLLLQGDGEKTAD